LVHIFRALDVTDERTLAVLANLKCTHRRLLLLICDEMRLHASYQKSIFQLSLKCPGTNIPSGAETVVHIPNPQNWDEVMQIFENDCVLTNGLEVGGIFEYWSSFWTTSMHVGHDQFMLLVQINYTADHMYVGSLVPANPGGTANLSRVPNVLRSAVGHLGLTAEYDELNVDHVGDYMRFVRVHANTTMQQVFDAIAFVEHWEMPEFNPSIINFDPPGSGSIYNMALAEESLQPGVTVQTTEAMALAESEQWRLCIDWPAFTFRWQDDDDEEEDDDDDEEEDDDDDEEEGGKDDEEEGGKDDEEAVDETGERGHEDEMEFMPDAYEAGPLMYDAATNQWRYGEF